ncbi:hypothetical protein KC331_g238 [Hortaea werneckii]|nr:hypothetical protein KC331_g238 [Hortaea werneckii]KAI7722693.1 hypothetical protein KC353_g275 [Hortaea werneckii]
MVETRQTASQAEETPRQKQLNRWRAMFPTFGFDFDNLQVTELVALAIELGVNIRSYRGSKPRKADYLFFIEQHYARLRIQNGTAPDHYLFPGFDVSKKFKAPLRQILTQHGIRYCDDAAQTAIGDATASQLRELFAAHIVDMRMERGADIPAEPVAGMEALLNGVDSLFTPRDQTPDTSPGNPFLQAFPARSPAGLATPPATERSTATAQIAPRTPSTPAGDQEVPRPSETTAAVNGASPSPKRQLSPRKVAKLVRLTEEALCSILMSLQRSDLPCAAGLVGELRQDLRDELDLPAIDMPQGHGVRRQLTERKIKKLRQSVETAAVAVMDRLNESSIEEAIGAVEELLQDIEDEL